MSARFVGSNEAGKKTMLRDIYRFLEIHASQMQRELVYSYLDGDVVLSRKELGANTFAYQSIKMVIFFTYGPIVDSIVIDVDGRLELIA